MNEMKKVKEDPVHDATVLLPLEGQVSSGGGNRRSSLPKKKRIHDDPSPARTSGKTRFSAKKEKGVWQRRE